MMMSMRKETTGKQHYQTLMTPDFKLQLEIDASSTNEASQTTWSYHEDGRSYRIVFSCSEKGVSKTGVYHALRTRLNGFGREYWEDAVPHSGKTAKPKGEVARPAHSNQMSALRALEACYAEDQIEAKVRHEFAALREKVTARELAKLEKRKATLKDGLESDFPGGTTGKPKVSLPGKKPAKKPPKAAPKRSPGKTRKSPIKRQPAKPKKPAAKKKSKGKK